MRDSLQRIPGGVKDVEFPDLQYDSDASYEDLLSAVTFSHKKKVFLFSNKNNFADLKLVLTKRATVEALYNPKPEEPMALSPVDRNSLPDPKLNLARRSAPDPVFWTIPSPPAPTEPIGLDILDLPSPPQSGSEEERDIPVATMPKKSRIRSLSDGVGNRTG